MILRLSFIFLACVPARAVEFRSQVPPADVRLTPLSAALTQLPAAPAFPGAVADALLPPQLPVATVPPSSAETGPAAPDASLPAPRAAEREAADAQIRFDNAGAFSPSFAADGWSTHDFESASGGRIAYKRRDGGGGAARVYSGGLALQESFEPLFASSRKPAGPEYFMWTRGHPPTAFVPGKSTLDADARDLARMIALAGKDSPTGKVELALHSFGTLVFQRMVQLRRDPEVAAALKRLSGSRVVLLHATTHYDGSERKAGPEFEQMGMGARLFIDWLDGADAVARQWEAAARMNPLLGPTVSMWLAQWRAQREQALSMASKGAADMQRKDLQEPWDPAYDGIRKSLLEALKRDSRDPGWQEALLRRSNDMFRLEMTQKDAAVLRRLGVRLDFVHADGDKLLNWASAKTLFELFGIPSPDQAPAPGTELRDRSGLFRARIVSGDHYFPLKKSGELAEILDR